MSKKSFSEWIKVLSFKTNKKKKPEPPSEPPPAETKTIGTFLQENTETVMWIESKSPKHTIVRRNVTSNSVASDDESKYHMEVEKIIDKTHMSRKKTYPIEFRKKLTKARQDMGITQKEFAKKCNIKESVIKEIENGTATYDPAIMAKLSDLSNKFT